MESAFRQNPALPRVLEVELGGLRAGLRRVQEPLSERDLRGRDAGLAPWLAAGGSVAALAASHYPEPGWALAVGRAVRAGLPTAARCSVLGHAPLWGRFGEGFVGSGLARRLALHWDAVLLRGHLGGPPGGRILEVDPDGALRLHHFPDLAGQEPGALAALLKERLGPGDSLRIGPAGEAGLPFANLAAGGAAPSYVGRGGLGASLGAAGLQALFVAGDPVPDRPLPGLEDALVDSPRLTQRARFGSFEQVEGEALAAGLAQPDDLLRRRELKRRDHRVEGCSGCPTPCGWIFEGFEVRGRHNAVKPLGKRLGLSDEQALQLLATCNALGMDSKEAGDRLLREGSSIGDPKALDLRLRAWVRSPGTPSLSATPESERSDFPAHLPALQALARHVSARGPEPMRSFPFWLDRPQTLPPALRAIAEAPLDADPAELAHLVAWHEDLVLALDAVGFCSFSAAGLLADGAADLDRLASWLEFRDSEELLGLGRALARAHRQRRPAQRVPRIPDARLQAAAQAYEALREGTASPSKRGGFPDRKRGSAAPELRSGHVLLRATGSLADALGQARSPEGVRLELCLPASLDQVFAAAVQRWPQAQAWLVREGAPLPATYRAGARLGLRDEVRDGDRLDLVLAIAGG